MTGKPHFKIPDVRRVLKLARDQDLNVESFEVSPDGAIRVVVRERDGEVAVPLPNEGAAA